MQIEINDYNWEQAFLVSMDKISPAIGMAGKISLEKFTREDVKRVILLENGENEGLNWIGLFELNDGRFAFIEAGCDYTGWDCQSGGHIIVGDSEDFMIKYGMGDTDRKRFGIKI